jgi:hypothetical protein
MSVDLGRLGMTAQAMPSLTAQMEAMKVQQTFATLQMCQNLVLSQYLYQDEKDGSADAKCLRATAKALIQTFLDGQEITTD